MKNIGFPENMTKIFQFFKLVKCNFIYAEPVFLDVYIAFKQYFFLENSYLIITGGTIFKTHIFSTSICRNIYMIYEKSIEFPENVTKII